VVGAVQSKRFPPSGASNQLNRSDSPLRPGEIRFRPQPRDVCRSVHPLVSLFADNTFWFCAHDGELFDFPLVDDGLLCRTRKPARVAGSRGPYHVHMQWEEMRVRDTASGGALRGTLLRRATVRADTLSPISTDPESLAVSDVVPVVLSAVKEGVPRPSGESGLPGVPIASRTVEPGRPLGLYFEVYHLAMGESDRTRYTIEYTAYRKTDRGALERLFQDAEEVKTSARFTYSGSSRRTTEVLRVGFDRWPDEAGPLLLRVEVTDEVTGQEVGRSISFRPADR